MKLPLADNRGAATNGSRCDVGPDRPPRHERCLLLDIAEADGRVLLTLDKDFWQLAIQRRTPLERSGVILFRVHPAIPENITPLVLRTMTTDQDWTGHASVVSSDRVLMVRSRRPEET